MLPRSDRLSLYLIHRGGLVMLKTITKNMFDVVMGLMLFGSVFYLAVVTHIIPLPESAFERLAKFSVNVRDVLVACFAWLLP